MVSRYRREEQPAVRVVEGDARSLQELIAIGAGLR